MKLGYEAFARSLSRPALCLPTVCIVCDRSIYRDSCLCADCETQLPWITRACVQCGIATEGVPLLGDRCGRCLLQPPPFQQCHSLFHYVSPINRLLAHFKYHGRLEIGLTLSGLLSERTRACWEISSGPDLLIPVPLHRSRIRSRGFNQALEIARVMAGDSGIPLARDVVIRSRPTAAQTSMTSSRERLANLRNAFEVVRQDRLETVTSVAIIDDVVTTTATVGELSKTLLRQGIQRIEVWSLARASA